MRIFDFQLKDIEFHVSGAEVNQQIRSSISQLQDMRYSLHCPSKSNQYQLISDFDTKLGQQLLQNGAAQDQLVVDCEMGIVCDLTLKLHGIRVAIEIEKADRRKILYDILKAHIYVRSGADFVVLMVPKNWAHSSGTIDLFDYAKKELDLCIRYGMCTPEVAQKLIIVGFRQYYDSQPHTHRSLKSIKKQCKEFFDNVPSN